MYIGVRDTPNLEGGGWRVEINLYPNLPEFPNHARISGGPVKQNTCAKRQKNCVFLLHIKIRRTNLSKQIRQQIRPFGQPLSSKTVHFLKKITRFEVKFPQVLTEFWFKSSKNRNLTNSSFSFWCGHQWRRQFFCSGGGGSVGVRVPACFMGEALLETNFQISV